MTLIEDDVKVEVLDGSAKLLSLMSGEGFTANAIGALLDGGADVEATSEQRSNDLLKSPARGQQQEPTEATKRKMACA